MKNFKKIFAIILTLCMMSTLFIGFGVSAGAETSTETTPKTVWKNNNGEQIAQNYGYNFADVMDDDFSFGVYRHGNTTTVASGWETLTTSDYNGTSNYIKTNGTPDGHIINAHQYSHWASQSSGIKWTAPFTGTITITYQLSSGDSTYAHFLIGKGTMKQDDNHVPSGALLQLDFGSNVANNADYSDFTTSRTFSMDVSVGEDVYFVMANRNDFQTMWFFINSIEYTSIAQSGDATVVGYSISALETPVVNFYVQLDGNPLGTTAAITVGSDAPISVKGVSYTGVGPDGTNYKATDYVYVYSVPVAAKKMTETITISIKKDGQELLSENTTYSVNQYCQAQVAAYVAAGSGATQDQIDVAKACTSILVYGRSMQKYFNYNTDNLPAINATLLELVSADMQ